MGFDRRGAASILELTRDACLIAYGMEIRGQTRQGDVRGQVPRRPHRKTPKPGRTQWKKLLELGNAPQWTGPSAPDPEEDNEQYE